MAFKGRVAEPGPTCTDPQASHLNICQTPWWTFFIRSNTIWECPKCERQYRLEWVAAGADAFKSWERYTPKQASIDPVADAHAANRRSSIYGI